MLQGWQINPQFFGCLVIDTPRPHESVDELLDGDQSACCDAFDNPLFLQGKVRVVGDRASFEMHDLVGQGAPAFSLVRCAIDLDAVRCPFPHAPEMQAIGERDVEMRVAALKVSPWMPSMNHAPSKRVGVLW
ncbi:hypothetical protein [Rhodococcus opacus]|uniref:hypothetical protein n=1 Tax=Rhodococcus opacus TaxID=37919 RepID=UPI0013DF34BA|nr:hypothetical protein [Rhodococcus opacus]